MGSDRIGWSGWDKVGWDKVGWSGIGWGGIGQDEMR